jgi:hypothetical protein
VNRKNILHFISILFQYLPRLFYIFTLSRQIVMAIGVMTETAWAGASYNLILYMLASHVRHRSPLHHLGSPFPFLLIPNFYRPDEILPLLQIRSLQTGFHRWFQS